MCKIHHAAFDRNIIGINPDYYIHVRKDILEESDGPMLKYGLQSLENQKIILPGHHRDYPDQIRLEERFDQFLKASWWNRIHRKIGEYYIINLKGRTDLPRIDTSNFKNNLNKSVYFIQNVIESWINRSVDVNKKIQRLVLPSGILDNPENRQYLTPEVNRLFRITSELSMISEDVKKIPHWFKWGIRLSTLNWPII